MTFLDRINSGAILVSDGATGTNLQARGLAQGTSPESWLFDRPEEITRLHRDFVDAGSDLILTCTFGASPLRLHGSGLESRVTEVNRRACERAREAVRGTDVFVGADIGPSGQMFEPMGTLTYDAAFESFQTQASVLAAFVDLFVLETFFDLDEAEAAVKAVQSVTRLPIIVSFSFDRGRRTMMGVRPEQVAERFVPLGVTAIGANCGRSLEDTGAVLEAYAAAAPGVPLWAKPNAGLPEGADNAYAITPDDMAAFTRRAIDTGARIVGGCCGSTPEHLRAIADAAHHR